MVKIKPELYHKCLLMLNGKQVQSDKVVEELLELRDAIDLKDRAKIVEELGDVENVLPYLQLIYLHNEPLEIKNVGKVQDYNFVCSTLIRLIHSYRTTGNYGCYKALLGYTQYFCGCLWKVYADYNICTDEIQAVISYKQRRTIMNKAKEIMHV
jgi:phosphoribosyl-ATP pyrophosphohydrolase